MAYIAEPFGLPQVAAPPQPKPRPPEKVRFASIDALKGVSILLLWLVNASLYDPAIPAQLKPGSWGHMTLADCVFPALLLGVGAGIALSAAFRSQSRESLGRFMLASCSRAFWLVLFGVLVESSIAHRPVFDCGALQLMGIAYLINALFSRTPIVLRVFLAEGLLLAFYGWVKVHNVPGTMPGTFNEKANFIQYYDDTVLAAHGLRGILALIPMTSIMMTGSVLGGMYLHDESRLRRGLIFLGCGGTLTFFGWLWSLDMPMSSAMWTSSYALFATGFAVAVLGLFNLLFDFDKGHSVAYPIAIPGTSILLAIAAPIFLKTMILDVWKMPNSGDTFSLAISKWIGTTFSSPLSNWVYPIGSLLVWWCVLAIAYHRRKWLRARMADA
jgi:predicted acyltransferase